MTVICECGVLECAEQIELDVVTYERVRADASLFVVIPGHEIPEVEHIVEEHDGFHIIRKDAGAAAALAVERDPRG